MLDAGALDTSNIEEQAGNCAVFVWQVLWLGGSLVSVLEANLANGVSHDEVTGTLGVVPREVDSGKPGTSPIGCDSVVCLEGGEEMVCMSLFAEFNTKVIDTEDEHDGSP